MRNYFVISMVAGVCAMQPVLAQNSTQNALDEEEFRLPELDLPEDRLSAMPSVQIQRFEFNGNQAIPTEVLRQQVSGYEGREISAEELQEVRNIITRHYVDQGYINSGAIIPDQEVVSGVVRLDIVEGRLTQVNYLKQEGNRLRESYIKGRLQADTGGILNTKQLQERLQILQQNPLVRRFDAELGPGLRRGEASLNLQVDEARAWDLNFNVNNHRSPSVGAVRGELEFRHRNVAGWGDTVYARYGLAEGLDDYTLDYSVPITSRDTTIGIHLESSDSQVVSEPFNQLDVESEATTYSISIKHPFYKRYTEDFHYKVFDAGISLERRNSKTFLLGRGFSFPPLAEEQNGESDITAIRLTQNWLDRSRTRVVAAASTFGFGIDALDSTINDDINSQTGEPMEEPDSKFVTWVGQFRWVQRLENFRNSQLWVRADAQWASEDLLPLEKFAIGGASTVRGYRENQLTRDMGVVLSVEVQIPVFELPIPGLSGEGDGMISIAPFVDYGWGENKNLATPNPKSIYSVGLGLLWDIGDFAEFELYWGESLNDSGIPTPEDSDIQDDGLHFMLRIKIAEFF
ncbi:MAG: ShlB/FhaC/HecB family hemolysin secretion/activation protein [Pseudomonadota bacterium]